MVALGGTHLTLILVIPVRGRGARLRTDMAVPDPGAELLDEATCSICRELYTDPVTLGCGHSFCLDCLTRFKASEDLEKSCPECRHEFNPEEELKLNKRLGNIAEKLKTLQIAPGGAIRGRLCEEHGERLQLFCETDGELLCVVCSASRKHRTHLVTPIDEAAPEHKKSLRGHLERLKKELKDLQTWAAKERRTTSELEGIFKHQNEKILNTFKHLEQFLEKEKEQILSKLEKEHKEKMMKILGKLSELEKQQTTHRDLIKEIEGKCQQQDVDLLKNMRMILSRCDKVKAQNPQQDAVVEQTRQSIGQFIFSQDKHLELIATIPAELEWRRMKTYATAVTLDPDTAHRDLILSEGGRSVRHADRAQDVPDTPQRFNPVVAVLGRARLSSGRHYWEVEVGDKTGWTLGVCDAAVSRKGTITLAPKNGYWTVVLRDGPTSRDKLGLDKAMSENLRKSYIFLLELYKIRAPSQLESSLLDAEGDADGVPIDAGILRC